MFTYSRFCVFAWLRFCAFWCFLWFWCFLVLFCAWENIFVNKKKFKTALITSFILLLKSYSVMCKLLLAWICSNCHKLHLFKFVESYKRLFHHSGNWNFLKYITLRTTVVCKEPQETSNGRFSMDASTHPMETSSRDSYNLQEFYLDIYIICPRLAELKYFKIHFKYILKHTVKKNWC